MGTSLCIEWEGIMKEYDNASDIKFFYNDSLRRSIFEQNLAPYLEDPLGEGDNNSFTTFHEELIKNLDDENDF